MRVIFYLSDKEDEELSEIKGNSHIPPIGSHVVFSNHSDNSTERKFEHQAIVTQYNYIIEEDKVVVYCELLF